MSVVLTYDAALSRVRVTATGLGTALVATVERSINQVTWSAVRGGTDVAVTAGALSRIVDDYEFEPDVPNYYRVVYKGTAATPVAGTVAHGNNASVSPGIPAGTQGGDAMYCWAAIRNTGVGQPSTISAGWTLLANVGSAKLYGKIAAGAVGVATTDTAPTVTFTGGAAGDDTSARIVAVRGASLTTPAGGAAGAGNASAQSIAFPGIPVVVPNCFVGVWGWKQDDWTSAAPAAGFAEAFESTTTTGNDQGIVMDYVIQTTATTVAAGSIAITGGVSAPSIALTAAFEPATVAQSNSTTPALGSVWLKFAGRPFLNRPVTVVGWSDVTRAARGGLFAVRGRTYPVAVTEVRGPRKWSMKLMTADLDAADELDHILAGGDVALIHVPADGAPPSGWVHIETVAISRPSERALRRYFTLDVTECAPPVVEIVGSTATYQTALSSFATYADELAVYATYSAALEMVADPDEVIVG